MTVIETRGAPRAQGHAQGAALAGDVRDRIARERRALGRFGFWRALARARRGGGGRTLARFLPQQHERIEGLALASGVPIAALEWLELAERRATRVCVSGASLVLDLDPELAWIARRSEPDAGGFASVEIAAPALVGCFAGVNRAGVAVACAAESARGEPPLRLLAQDLLLRASGIDAALEHARRRARYLRASGTLYLAHPSSAPRALAFRAGAFESSDVVLGMPGARSVRVDAAAPKLEWLGATLAP